MPNNSTVWAQGEGVRNDMLGHPFPAFLARDTSVSYDNTTI